MEKGQSITAELSLVCPKCPCTKPLQLQLLPPPLPQLHPAQPLPLSTRISPAPKPTPKKSVLTFLESKGRRREKGARAGANKENEAA